MTTNPQVFEITIKSNYYSDVRVSAELIYNFLIYNYGEKQCRESCRNITERQELNRQNNQYNIEHIVTIEGGYLRFGRRIYDKLAKLYPDWELQIEYYL